MSALAFIAYAIVSAAVCAVLARCVEFACELRRLPQRWVWLVSTVMSLVLPLSTLVRPQPTSMAVGDPLSMPADEGAQAVVPVAGNAGAVSLDTGTVGTARAETATTERVPIASPIRASVEPVMQFALWGSLLVVPLLALREWRVLRRMRRHWSRSTLNGVPVMIAEQFGPAVVGVLDPQIVVPRYVAALSPAEQHLVLVHEQEHLRAHDTLLSSGALWCVALAPWNPLLWWQYLRLRQAIELDCDARVLRRAANAHTYGALLLEVATRAPRVGLLATAFLEPARSSLHRRIARLAQVTRRATPTQWLTVAVFGGAAVLVLSLIPRPARQARVRTAADFVADSGVVALLKYTRSGQWAKAESIGLGFLAKWPAERGIDESCAVLIEVASSQLLLERRDDARQSLARFDRACANAVYVGWIPQESNRVRRALYGSDAVDSSRRFFDDGTVLVSARPTPGQIAALFRGGHYAVVERAGRTYFESFDRRTGTPDWCAVRLSIALAQAVQGQRQAATDSLQSLESPCAVVAPHDSLPITIHSVRLVLRGDALATVLPTLAPPVVSPADRAVRDVLRSNREKRYDDAITIGRAYLGSGPQLGEPQTCAVQISVTFALAVQQRSSEARTALAQFDQACTGVRYSDWFPKEADRVRRVVNGEDAKDVYGAPGPRAKRTAPVAQYTKWGLPAMPFEPYWKAQQRFVANRR